MFLYPFGRTFLELDGFLFYNTVHVNLNKLWGLAFDCIKVLVSVHQGCIEITRYDEVFMLHLDNKTGKSNAPLPWLGFWFQKYLQ